jgi:hypothetical protein
MVIKNTKLQELYRVGFSTFDIMVMMGSIKKEAKNNQQLLNASRMYLALEKIVKKSKV